MELIDGYGRKINYLRLSVTDRCNLRCRYCMPAEGVEKLGHGDLLSYEELHRMARACVASGIQKIRVTGGEPLVRKGLVGFLEKLAAIPGLRELVLTTNGILLEEMAFSLRRAGVARLNVSLDSLDPENFARITRGGDLSRVIAGIEAAERAGFPPVKINMVVMRGINDHEILRFAELTREKPCTVRFIEYMPTLRDPEWDARAMPGNEIMQRIAERYSLLPLVGSELSGPARNFRIEGAAGTLGVITPVSGHFCASCNRIRMTASGAARGCLFSESSADLKTLLSYGDSWMLRHSLHRIVAGKPGRHSLGESRAGQTVSMSGIGG